MFSRNSIFAMLLLLVTVSFNAQAALLGRDLTGDGSPDAYYDTVLDITWLGDASLALSNQFGLPDNLFLSNGAMDWFTAQDWIEAMNGSNYLGYSEWRLPSADVDGDGMVTSCLGGGVAGCEDNELGYMYWENDGFGSGSPFENLLVTYWYQTEFPLAPDVAAYFFSAGGIGNQGSTDKGNDYTAWPVINGDLSIVPVPAAVWLLGSALGLLGWFRRSTAGIEIARGDSRR